MARGIMLDSGVFGLDEYLDLDAKSQVLYHALMTNMDIWGIVADYAGTRRMLGAGKEDLQALEEVGLLIPTLCGRYVMTRYWAINRVPEERLLRTRRYPADLDMLFVTPDGMYTMDQDAGVSVDAYIAGRRSGAAVRSSNGSEEQAEAEPKPARKKSVKDLPPELKRVWDRWNSIMPSWKKAGKPREGSSTYNGLADLVTEVQADEIDAAIDRAAKCQMQCERWFDFAHVLCSKDGYDKLVRGAYDNYHGGAMTDGTYALAVQGLDDRARGAATEAERKEAEEVMERLGFRQAEHEAVKEPDRSRWED